MLPFQLHTSVWSLFKTNGFNRDSEKCPNFCIVSKLTFVIWGLNQMLIKGSPSMQKGNTSLCKSRQRQSWSNNQIFLVIIKGAKSHTHTHTLCCSFFSRASLFWAWGSRGAEAVFTHQLMPVIVSSFANTCPGWQMHHLINAFEN